MSRLIAELTATCNALGYAFDGKNKYFVIKECKESVRELIRYLRRDDENHEIRSYLGSACILQKDLIPLLIDHHNDEEVLELLLRLLVNLTTPALLLYNEELPAEKVSRQYYLKIIKYLQQYKQSFTKQQLWTVLSEKLSKLLQMDWTDRGEEKSLIIVRILILVRNVLHIPADTDLERRPDNDASTHDQVLWALHEGGMINLLLYIATSEDERQYYFHVLEIISLMLRDQNAEVLASASVQRSIAEKQRDEEELMAVRKKEIEDKQMKIKKHIAARHSRFGGLYVVRGVKAIGDNDLVVNSLDSNLSLSFDRRKNKLKTPKNRRPMQSDTLDRKSAFSVCILMKEFCIEFLNGAYNSLMHYIREILHRGKAQANDESYYFWAMRFFMEFNRHFKFEVKLISETMDIAIFHFTQDRIEDWRGKLITDKKKIHLWSKRMHLGLKAYKELLYTLLKMYQHEDLAVRESAHTMMSNIFYVVEYRDLLMGLLNLFDEIKFSKEYLTDLIEANHIFMKMLEHFCKKHRTLVVQKKVKVQRRKKKTKKPEGRAVLNYEPTTEKWDILESRITEIFENNTELNVQAIPFDAASDIPIDEQKVEAMRKIRFLLLKSEVEEAIGLFRASREVWPENDCFGSANMTISDESSALKEIFFADIGLPAGANAEQNVADESEESEPSANDEDVQVANVSVHEQSLQFADFIKKFAKPKIAQACCLLLSQFEKNTSHTNHCVLKLLHRIAFDCKFAAILFQASVFRTFQRILHSDKDEHKELKKFVTFIIRKFTDVAQKNKKVYMELLFWKGNKEAYEIEEGYGSMTSGNAAGRGTWTEEQEDELQRLFAEYERDKPDQDLVDWVHENLIDQSRSRRGLIHKMRELGLLEGVQKRININRRPPKEFSEEEISQITELFNEFREAFDPVGCIMERIDVKRPKKRIVDKIVELGLVQDRRELRKKRIGQSRRRRGIGEDSDDRELIDSDSDSESDKENSNATSNDTLNVPHYLSSAEVVKTVKELVSLGMKDAIEWILSSLEDVIEDIGADESDVPLLPLADFSMKAMDDSVFQRLLIALGIKRPLDFQEMYWRIPGSWQANDLRKRIALINSGLDENTSIDDILRDNDDENVMNQDDLQRFEDGILDGSTLNISENGLLENNVETKICDNSEITRSKSIQNKKRKRFDVGEFKRIQECADRPRKPKKIRRILNDDDSDEEILNNISVDKLEQQAKINSGDDFEVKKEESVSLKKAGKKRILSSDESDNNEKLNTENSQESQIKRLEKLIIESSSSDNESDCDNRIKGRRKRPSKRIRRIQSKTAPSNTSNSDESDQEDDKSQPSTSRKKSRYGKSAKSQSTTSSPSAPVNKKTAPNSRNSSNSETESTSQQSSKSKKSERKKRSSSSDSSSSNGSHSASKRSSTKTQRKSSGSESERKKRSSSSNSLSSNRSHSASQRSSARTRQKNSGSESERKKRSSSSDSSSSNASHSASQRSSTQTQPKNSGSESERKKRSSSSDSSSSNGSHSASQRSSPRTQRKNSGSESERKKRSSNSDSSPSNGSRSASEQSSKETRKKNSGSESERKKRLSSSDSSSGSESNSVSQRSSPRTQRKNSGSESERKKRSSSSDSSSSNGSRSASQQSSKETRKKNNSRSESQRKKRSSGSDSSSSNESRSASQRSSTEI